LFLKRLSTHSCFGFFFFILAKEVCWNSEILEQAPAYLSPPLKKINKTAGCWWLTPEILATQEAEIRRIAV
jgi:hypothetical protein